MPLANYPNQWVICTLYSREYRSLKKKSESDGSNIEPRTRLGIHRNPDCSLFSQPNPAWEFSSRLYGVGKSRSNGI